MSDHDEAPEVVDEAPAPADPPEVEDEDLEDDEDQAEDEAPKPHATARGFGVVGKFSTTDRSGDL